MVDISKEYIAVREASRLNIPVFAMVDTNSDPNQVEFPIPSNDDASKSISLLINIICESIEEGLNERKMEREKEAVNKEQAEKEAAMAAEPDEIGEKKPAVAKDEKGRRISSRIRFKLRWRLPQSQLKTRNKNQSIINNINIKKNG